MFQPFRDTPVLQQEDENFVINRSSGYSVTTRTSTGLEPMNVDLRLSKSFSVCFTPKQMTKTNEGITETNILNGLKIPNSPTPSGLGIKQVFGFYNPFGNDDSLGTLLFALLTFKTLIGPFPLLDSKLIKYLCTFHITIHHRIII